MMDMSTIRNDADLIAALVDVEQLMEGDPQLGTPAGDKLDVLAKLIEAYEAKNSPIDKPEPAAAI